MFSVNYRVTLGRTMFTFLIQKSEKQRKVLRVCLENLPMGGPLGNQTFLYAAHLRKVSLPSGPPYGKFFQTILKNFRKKKKKNIYILTTEVQMPLFPINLKCP